MPSSLAAPQFATGSALHRFGEQLFGQKWSALTRNSTISNRPLNKGVKWNPLHSYEQGSVSRADQPFRWTSCVTSDMMWPRSWNHGFVVGQVGIMKQGLGLSRWDELNVTDVFPCQSPIWMGRLFLCLASKLVACVSLNTIERLVYSICIIFIILTSMIQNSLKDS